MSSIIRYFRRLYDSKHEYSGLLHNNLNYYGADTIIDEFVNFNFSDTKNANKTTKKELIKWLDAHFPDNKFGKYFLDDNITIVDRHYTTNDDKVSVKFYFKIYDSHYHDYKYKYIEYVIEHSA